ncbi:FAD-dependent oxidoreductase [Agrobacterium sp. GD03638]|nr:MULTISPECIES: FAD-dependent oxidoreductase [unclassified Agrobacterium]MDH0615039.1 FAD-dependent oxidoreductase [Agrobacterium sp. GD03872]MDH1060422.1 FAD-dependent oxidoreductase [Agrobacterium sp. GD03992]MDH2212338.1 FAD-dependent oxidoreductase [Agrobacterium sp. GD03643]MDH2220502.1 FAD-dependent oxidoreductase [Agrobacterium sp. GD03638]
MSERLPSQQDWTVIVGSGIAGLMAALTLAPQPVLLVTRGVLGGETSSAWAQGGIAASLGPDDSAALHLADTLAAGDGLCDKDMAAEIVSAAPAVIEALERAGVRFDRDMPRAGSSSGWRLPMAEGASCMPKGTGRARPSSGLSPPPFFARPP